MTSLDREELRKFAEERKLYALRMRYIYKEGYKMIFVDLSYVKSLLGILEATLSILALIGLICAIVGAIVSCVDGKGNYGEYYYMVVAFIVFAFYFWKYEKFATYDKDIDESWFLRMVPLLKTHYKVGLFFTILFFAAFMVIGEKWLDTCQQFGYFTASACGLITTVALIIETSLTCLLSYPRIHKPTNNRFLNMLGVPSLFIMPPKNSPPEEESVPESA